LSEGLAWSCVFEIGKLTVRFAPKSRHSGSWAAHPSLHLAFGLFANALIQKPFSGLSLSLSTAKPAMLHHQGNPLLEGDGVQAVFGYGFGRQSPFLGVDSDGFRTRFSDSRLIAYNFIL